MQEDVLPWCRALRILNRDVGALLKERKQELRQLLLSAIVVDADAFKATEVKPVPVYQ